MALTSSYDQNTKTLTVTKGLNGDGLSYNAATVGAAAGEDWFGSDVTTINATKVSKALSVNLYDSKNGKSSAVTSLTLGKGADEVTVAGSALSITTGNGKDTLTLTSDTNKITITDFDQKNDAIVLGAGMDTALPTATFSGANVTLTFSDTTKATHTFTFTGGKDKKITIANTTGEVVWEQSFQAAGDDEYNFDNNNTGAVLTSDAAYVAGASRSAAIKINLTGSDQIVLGGKGKDTVVTDASGLKNTYYEIAGGKGDDTFIIAPETEVRLTDYTLGGKEKIQLGEGLSTIVGHRTVGDNVYITLGGGQNKGTATAPNYETTSIVVVENGKWDQVAAEKKKQISIISSDGTVLATSTGITTGKGFQDVTEAVIKTVTKATSANKTGNYVDLTAASDTTGHITLATGGDTIDATDVNYITFKPSTAASIKAGQTFMTITAGGGKDTLVGADSSITSVNTAYVAASQINYGTTSGTDYDAVSSTKFIKVTIKNTDNTYTELKLGITSNKSADKLTVTIYDTDGTTKLASGETTDLTANSKVGMNVENGKTTPYKYFIIPKSIARLTKTNSFNDIDGTAVAKLATATEGLEYTYNYVSNSVSLDGGKGNDYLMGGVAGANLFGGVGNDTLRGNGGQSTMYGGAGNDVFLLTGESDTVTDGATQPTHVINDYWSGTQATYQTKAEGTAAKKAYGSDKIVVAYDTYKTKAPVARATLIGGSFTGDSVAGDLVLTVQGQQWLDSVAADTTEGTPSIAAHFEGDSGIANAGEEDSISYTANYDFKVKAGDVITLVDQGVTYKQTVEAATATEAIVTASYNGRVNDIIELINAANSNKAERLVAGRGTTSIAGGKKVDTIVGGREGGTSMSGGNGNDIFIVGEGDAVMDYSNTGATGKDKIQVSSLNLLSRQKNTSTETVTVDWGNDSWDSNINAYVGTFKVGDTATSDKLYIYCTIEGSDKYVSSISYDAATYDVSNLPSKGTRQNSNPNNLSVTYAVDENGLVARATNAITAAGEIKIGGFTIAQGTGKAITFQQITETPVLNKKGVYASTKKTTDTMIRTFGTDATASVIAGGASTYLEAFANLDDQVVAIKGGSKAAKIVNSAKHVSSIIGGAKADTITVGKLSDLGTKYTDTTVITVTSGKGNDVIKWDGAQEAVITDYTTVKLKSNKLSAGDVILVDSSDTAIAGFKGSDVVLSSGGQTLTLKNGKDKVLAFGFSTAGYTVADTIGAGTFVTVSSANPHEYLYTKKTEVFADNNVHATDGAGTSETWIINAAVSTKAQTINGGIAAAAKVGTIYGGKGADTIIAGTWGASDEDKAAAAASNGFHGTDQLINAGAGNDVIFLTASETTVDVVTGAGTDILVFNTDTKTVRVSDYTAGTDKLFFQNGAYISSVASVKPSENGNYVENASSRSDTIAGGTKRNPTTVNLVDINVTLSNGKTVTFQDIKESTPKLTVVTSTIPGGKNYFSLNYFDGKIEIGAKDYTSSYVDLTGAYASDITVAKAAKKVTIQGASANSTISVENGGKNAITFQGNTYDDFNATSNAKGATYNGGGGADIYKAGGLNASDTVVLGSGNDSILSGGKAHVVSGIGNNVFVLGTGDAYNIDSFTTTDRVVLANTATLKGVSYASDTKALTITTSENDTTGAEHTGTITLNNYEAGKRVNIYKLGTNGKTLNADLIRSYGSDTLTLAKGDSTLINVSSAFDNYTNGTGNQITKTVDASAMTSAVVLSDSTKAVTTFIGGSGKDAIYAFDAADSVVTTLTGGKGNDTFILAPLAAGDKNAKYVITDYESGKDVIQFGTTADYPVSKLSAIGDYSANYSLSGGDVYFSDTGLELTIKNGTGSTIQLGTTKTSFSDPVNVKLSKTATQTDWSTGLYDTDRVVTFDASANTKDAIKFTATGTGFTTFTGNAKGSTVVIGDSNAKGVTVDLGKAGGTLTLNTGSYADTVKYSGGNIEVTNFSTNDTFNGVTGITGVAAVAAGTDAAFAEDGKTIGGKSDSSVTFNIKSNTVKVTGDGVKFTIDDWTQGALTDGSTDTYVFSYTKSVSVGGVTYAYGTATTTAKNKAEANEKATRTVSASYMERYTADDLISYGDTIYSGQEGDSPFAEISTAKVAVDVSSTSDAEVNELIKGVTATFSGVGKERQDK